MSREVVEGVQRQGEEEQIAYKIDVSNWGDNPTNVSAKAYALPYCSADITESVMPTNTPSVSGNVITLSPLKGLIAGRMYRIEVKFKIGSNVLECWFKVACEQ